MKNPVKHHMHKSVRASVEASKRRSLQSEATLRDAREDALNELECSQTITLRAVLLSVEMRLVICTVMLYKGVKSDIGSSSILIDNCEEDEK